MDSKITKPFNRLIFEVISLSQPSVNICAYATSVAIGGRLFALDGIR